MASDYEALVEDVAREIAHEDCRDGNMCGSPSCLCRSRAKAAIALIAERTKEATDAMCLTAIEQDNLKDIWSAMHAASALWPSHGTDGIDEKAK